MTGQAAPLIAKLRALADDLMAEAFAGLSESELELMRTKLTKIRNNLTANPQGRMTA